MRSEWFESLMEGAGLTRKQVKQIEREAMMPGNLMVMTFADFAGEASTIRGLDAEEIPEAVIVLKTQCDHILCAYETIQDAYDEVRNLGFPVETHIYEIPKRLH